MSIRRIRLSCWALIIAITATLAASCGSENDAASSAAVDTETLEEPTDDEQNEPPALVVPALPIESVIETDHGRWSTVGFEQYLFSVENVVVVRHDTTTGQEDRLLLSSEDHPYITSAGLFGIGDYVLVGGYNILDGGWNVLVVIDPGTFSEVGRIDNGQALNPVFGSEGDDNTVLVWMSGEIFELDMSTATLGPALDINPSNLITARVDDELWTVEQAGNGTVSDIVTGAAIAEFDLDRTFAQYGAQAYSTPDSVWIADTTTATLLQVSRTDHSVRTVELNPFFGDGADLSLSLGSRAFPYFIGQLRNGSETDWVLIHVDEQTGEVLSAHTIATADFEYWGQSWADSPDLAQINDRLFIRDHMRRIVEVDPAQLAAPSTEPWQPVDLPWQAELSAEEQEAANAMLATLSETAGWETFTIAIDGDGDEAWGSFLQDQPSVGEYVHIERTDGVWGP